MKLSNEDLLRIIEKNPNRNLIAFGQEQHKKARLHMYGVGIDDHLTQINGFEKPFNRQLRVKYMLNNMDIFARLRKPTEKVFTARGGSSYYNVGTALLPEAERLNDNVRNGFSCKEWNKKYWLPHFMDDPMGMVFVEVGKKGACYPTYKSITSVYDYEFDGLGFEYIIFNVSDEQKAAMGIPADKGKCYRVVDDESDKIVIHNANGDAAVFGPDGKLEIVEGQSFPNYFGDVPARVNSSIANPDGDGFISIFHYCYGLADAYMLEMGMKLTHKFRHAFAKYWEYADDCNKCKGSGRVNGKKCSDCEGYGKRIMMNVSDVKLVEYPTKDAPSPAQFGGYIEPSKIYFEIAAQELADLEQKMNLTAWGAKPTTKLQAGKGLSLSENGTSTATEVLDNRQPEIEAIRDITKEAQAMDKFIMDHIIAFKLKQPNYIRKGGCSKTYGTRYLIEEPDALIERIMKMQKEGASATILYGMYGEYLEAKFAGDGVSLNLHQKLLKIEPFKFTPIGDLVEQMATPEEVRLKRYWPEWLAQVENAKLILGTVKELQTDFVSFCEKKPLPLPPTPPAPAGEKKKPTTTKTVKP